MFAAESWRIFWIAVWLTRSSLGQTNVTEGVSNDGTSVNVPLPDFGILDIKVGKIIEIKQHPEADKLYIETVDFGEAQPSIVVSSLVDYFKMDELLNTSALFMCNLKPTKLRGVVSQGMIMAVDDENLKVELVTPPESCVVGDVVRVEGFEYKPQSNLNSKTAKFQEILSYLKINENGEATFNGIPFDVGGKGPARTKTIRNVAMYMAKPSTISTTNFTQPANVTKNIR